MIGPLLTQNGGVLGPISTALGWLMNLIYVGLQHIGINNVAVTIIIFTVIIYLALMPLTIKQQKFSKMTQIMNPELQAIQKKYRGKRDQVSAQKMNEETQAVYRKYGVSPSGSCIFLVIQLPILFALYRVIYNVPGYITAVKNTFTELAAQIYNTPGSQKMMTGFLEKIQTYAMRGVSVDYTTAETAQNSIIDILYKCTSANWDLLKETFTNISSTLITTTQAAAEEFNNFLGVSIVYSPKNLISTSFHEGQYALIFIAILIPVISAATQFLNIRLMPTAANSNQSNMGGSLKIMNYMMPIYSFILVFFLPVGVGVYWITGAIVRSVQQFLINRHLDKQDLDEMIKKNQAKAEEKRKRRIEKKGVVGSQIAEAAKINTRQINNAGSQVRKDSMAARANAVKNSQGGSKKGKNNSNKKPDPNAKQVEETAAEETPVKLKQNSLAAKANMVREFNNRNTRK